jgi:DNA-binding NtrC family response regulator
MTHPATPLVLLVASQEFVLKLLEAYVHLFLPGNQVIFARNNVEVEYHCNKSFSAIKLCVVNYIMTPTDGLLITKYIKSKYPFIPTILLTRQINYQETDKLKKCGCDEIMFKPLNLSTVKKTFQSCVSKPYSVK